MSERKVHRCDGCSKISETPQMEQGWIAIVGEIQTVTKFKGEFTGIDYDYAHNKTYINNPDFCSFTCLVEWWRIQTNTSVDEAFDS